jgi:hypothetical protein
MKPHTGTITHNTKNMTASSRDAPLLLKTELATAMSPVLPNPAIAPDIIATTTLMRDPFTLLDHLSSTKKRWRMSLICVLTTPDIARQLFLRTHLAITAMRPTFYLSNTVIFTPTTNHYLIVA